MRQLRREEVARYAAPAAFLLAVTIAVLLVRAGLNDGGSDTTTTPTVATATTATSATTTRATTQTRRAPTAPAEFYTVESGDTYGSIASAQGTTVNDLRALNPDVDETALQPGQRIRVK